MRRSKCLIGVLLTSVMLSGCTSFFYEEKLPTNEISGDLTVTFLDVGQGNAILVEQDEHYMLVDGGDREYSSFVVSYLKQEGIDTLDYVIASHYDSDHINGVVGALNVFQCLNFWGPDYETDTRVYQSLQSILAEKGIETIYPNVGEEYSLGNATFQVVCPDAYNHNDVNDNSIGIKLLHGENSFLFCGDAGIEVENAMLQSDLDLSADVYLASHHGSAGSSSEDFLKAVNPDIVVFSVGADNEYGHPAVEVVNRVEQMGAEIYRTDLQGTITVISDGENLTWHTEKIQAMENDTELQSNEQQKEDVQDTEGQEDTEEQEDATQYVLNRNTMKFHYPDCNSVDKMNEANKAYFTGDREEVIEAGYSPCGNCNP